MLQPIDVTIDTRADIMIMSKPTYSSLKVPPSLKPTKLNLTSPGRKVKTTGEFVAQTIHKGAKYKVKIIVIDGD